jgi:MATE family multidrug resistance protein
MGLEPCRQGGTPAGGARELLRLAWPLILSNSLWTLQIFIDRIFLAHAGSDSLGAGMASAILFYTVLLLFQNTANYATAFVAQYVGAGRPREVGPIVWQALYFAALSGAALLLLIPLAGPLVALGGHEPPLRALETTYLRFLALSAPPMLVVAAACSFFAGRGDSRTVLMVNGVGLGVNALSAWVLILGHWGLPAWGIAGAGAATAMGTGASSVLALVLLFRRRYRAEFATVAGWPPDLALFRRLLRFGLPNGIFACLDALAWACFILLVGRLGPTDLAATTVGVTLNTVAILPLLGIGQAVEVLVGQRLGADEPDLAERSTWTGLRLASVIAVSVALAFVLAPDLLVAPFQGPGHRTGWEEIRSRVAVLLRFVAVFAAFDAANLVLSFALRGAGDTRFVTRVALALPWPVLVLPTWAAWYCGWGLYWAWGFASVYIMLLAAVYLVRFRRGRWRQMRVIEPAAPVPALAQEPLT